MTGTSAPKSRLSLALALLPAALAVVLMGGCLASRAPVPAPVQRTPEAEGRKARLEREAAEAPAAAQAAKPEAIAAKPEAIQEPAKEAAPEAAPATAKPEAQAAKAESAPTLSAEQLPAQELTLQGQYVQIASFGTEKNAQNAVAWLAANGYPSSRVVRVEQGGVVLHRVQAGPFQDPAAARGALDALKGQWPQAFIPAD